MAKYIPDISNIRWVILAPGRVQKPHIHKDLGSKSCFFCPGNEDQTPCEVDRISNGSKWLVRVFPNKFPITDIHEVIVHTPHHTKELTEMDAEEMHSLFIMYQKRLRTLANEGVPILFRNRGELAGTSIPHPHSQLILLPKQINLQALALEPVKNEITRNEQFVLYCPDFSQYPYEVWIAHNDCTLSEPAVELAQKIQLVNFSESELLSLALLLQKTIRALEKILGKEISYNYYFSPKPPFYLRIIPRVVTRGGFELGTGLSTNIVDPANAAEEYKKHM